MLAGLFVAEVPLPEQAVMQVIKFQQIYACWA